eukprot:COSAG02_NODE_1160_length_14177_cov_208.515130_2_plen_171_part_00
MCGLAARGPARIIQPGHIEFGTGNWSLWECFDANRYRNLGRHVQVYIIPCVLDSGVGPGVGHGVGHGVGPGVGRILHGFVLENQTEIGVGAGVGPSLSPPPFNNRLGEEDSIENSPELSWQLNLSTDSIEESSQETASQDLEAKNELANAQARIAKQKKRPSQMRRETIC